MRNLILALCVALGLSSSLAVAEVPAQEVRTLSKVDATKLFGANADSVDVALLSQQEMDETKGEFWDGVSALIAGAALLYQIGEDHKWW